MIPTYTAVHGLHHDAYGQLDGEDAHQVERRAVNWNEHSRGQG